MTIQYITWHPFYITKFDGRHIEDNINPNWDYEVNPVTCTQIAQGPAKVDNRRLSIVEGIDIYSESVQARFYESNSGYAIHKLTPAEALELVNEWEEGSFELDEDGITLIDLRAKEEI